MNFPEHGTAGWGSGKSEKVSGCSKLPPETSRAHLVPLKFPGENFPETIRNSLTCVYDDWTCVYDDVTCVYDHVTCVYDDMCV